MDDDDWGDFAESDAPPPPPAQFLKGQAVLYQTRGGDWVPTQVRSAESTELEPILNSERTSRMSTKHC